MARLLRRSNELVEVAVGDVAEAVSLADMIGAGGPWAAEVERYDLAFGAWAERARVVVAVPNAGNTGLLHVRLSSRA